MPLRITNTLTGQVEAVSPSHPDGILRMYHCGPTVYATPHLGNLRRFLFADLLVRTARFLRYRVRSVMNITDVGHLLGDVQEDHAHDRMLVAAASEGKSPERIAAQYIAEFFAALGALRAEPADYYPRATMHIPQMQAIIQSLVQKGLAYETSSGVYFEVAKFPGYGVLSGNTLAALQSGARVTGRAEKRNQADFALWIKAPKEHLLQWESPWGRGYPGWHIECSAMSMQILGETIDLHTGGMDNIFPHHENEIAQSDGATGKPVVRFWVHNEHLDLEGAKMSKSEGRVVTLHDLTERGYAPLAFRLLSLQTHYRSKLNFSWEAMEAAATALKSLREFTRRLQERSRQAAGDSQQSAVGADCQERLAVLQQRCTEALANDLGSPQALAAVFDFVHEINPALQGGSLPWSDTEAIRATLRRLDAVLQLLDLDAPDLSPLLPAEIQTLVAEREAARARGEYQTSDRIRNDVRARGFLIEDTSQGPKVFPAA